MDGLIKDAKQIVCIVTKGRGKALVEAVSEEFGIFNANFSNARGVGRSANTGRSGFGGQQERDVFSLTVEQERADELFEYLYFKAELDKPRNGLIYMQAAPRTTLMQLPEIDEAE
ncbi:MAG: hypothetical protein ACE37D_22285 [Pseudomonadales bacterium]